jgi:signal transduction histidine kinase
MQSWPSRRAHRATRSLARTESMERQASTARCDRWCCRSATDRPRRDGHHERPAATPVADDRRRLERDLHDGVQNELVALIVTLALAREDPETPPPLVETLAGLEARAQAALDLVRNIVSGIYPPLLADFGLADGRRLRARRWTCA